LLSTALKKIEKRKAFEIKPQRHNINEKRYYSIKITTKRKRKKQGIKVSGNFNWHYQRKKGDSKWGAYLT